MKRKITVTESELINSIEKIVKEQTATLGFGNTNGFNNLGMGLPTNKHRELGETGGGNYNVNVYYIIYSNCILYIFRERYIIIIFYNCY